MAQDRFGSGASLEPSGRAFEEALLRLDRLHIAPGSAARETFTEGSRIVTQALDIERLSFWVLIQGGRALRCYHLYHPSQGEVFEGSILQASDFPTYFRALESQRAIVLDDALNDPASRELREAYLEPLGITSMLDTPVYRAGRLIGVVCHEHLGPMRRWTPEERDFAVSVAEVVGRFCEESARIEAETALDDVQAQIAQLQQFDQLGRMAAGIAHDFRGVLSTVIGFGQLIEQDRAVPAAMQEYARLIVEAGQRGERLAQQLLTFGRGVPASPQVLDMGEELARMQPVLQLAVGPRVRLAIAAPVRLSRVMMDRALLERALLNLVSNASDAMAEGGTIRIETREVRRASGPERDVGLVAIEIVDDGAGMDEATRQRMFDPFFTTKKDPGSGLGLLIVQQAMARCGGRIEVDTSPGRGTRVRLLLPRIAGPGAERTGEPLDRGGAIGSGGRRQPSP